MRLTHQTGGASSGFGCAGFDANHPESSALTIAVTISSIPEDFN
jgi:hypothetical protein